MGDSYPLGEHDVLDSGPHSWGTARQWRFDGPLPWDHLMMPSSVVRAKSIFRLCYVLRMTADINVSFHVYSLDLVQNAPDDGTFHPQTVSCPIEHMPAEPKRPEVVVQKEW